MSLLSQKLYYKKLFSENFYKINWPEKFNQIYTSLNRPVSNISNEIGYSVGGYTNVHIGRTEPSFSMLWNIVFYLHVNPEWLFGNDGTILLDTGRRRDTADVIAERIRHFYIEENRYSQRKAAQQLGISSGAMSGILNLNISPSEKLLHLIADKCNLGFYWFMCGDESSRDYPCNQMMVDELWGSAAVRKSIYDMMEEWEETGEYNIGHLVTADLNTVEEQNHNSVNLAEMGARIKSLREQRNYSLRDFEFVTGCSRTVISRWERGLSKPDQFNLRRIAEKMKVGQDWILYGDESRRDYPCDKKMMEFLNRNEEVRREIRKRVLT